MIAQKKALILLKVGEANKHLCPRHWNQSVKTWVTAVGADFVTIVEILSLVRAIIAQNLYLSAKGLDIRRTRGAGLLSELPASF